MDKKKINQIHTVSLLVLGILSILLGLFRDSLPHTMQMAAAIFQIIIGIAVLVTSILKLRGNF